MGYSQLAFEYSSINLPGQIRSRDLAIANRTGDPEARNLNLDVLFGDEFFDRGLEACLFPAAIGPLGNHRQTAIATFKVGKTRAGSAYIASEDHALRFLQ